MSILIQLNKLQKLKILMFFEFIAFFLAVYAFQRIMRRKLSKPNFHGQIVWITGASSGIGQAMAYKFNEYGAKVIISARNQKQLQRVKSQCRNPEKVMVVTMDVVQYEATRKITERVIADLARQGQKIDIVVENAGISMRSDMNDYSFQNHVSMFNVNVNGVYNHLKTVVNHMVEYKTGHIVGISSVAAKLCPGARTSYAGSKNALIGLLDTLRTQLKPFGISVTNIMPGYIKTNISKNAMVSAQGQKFGSTDNNIDSGMDVHKFAEQSVRGIYRKQTEFQVSKSWWMPIAIAMRTLFPDLIFYAMAMRYKFGKKN